MASLSVLKHLVTKSVISFRPASSVATSYSFLNTETIRHDCNRSFDVDSRRVLATKPSFFADVFNRLSTRRLWRVIKRQLEVDKSTSVWIQPASTDEDAGCLYVSVDMPNVNGEGVNVTVSGNTLFIEGKDFDKFIKYMCWVDLPDIDSPDKIYNSREIKAELWTSKGSLKLIVPKLKKEETAYNVNVGKYKKPVVVG
ncbi:heat shock 22 kDa protein, mitochondrial-like [Rutidosis leptorrhynchoides]|uniref:heat shock 22 kDa protein, mitochondrial-like n=1 Tax=Rutidosis leptorrhynchoides TaxID=125765 RepID=UPI003A99A705